MMALMDDKPLPAWIVNLTAFLALGICCAGLFLTAPAWAHLIPSLPTRAAPPPALPPTATPTRFALPTATPDPTRSTILRFPTMAPEEMPTPRPTPAPIPTRPAPAGNRFVGQGDSVVRFSLTESGAVRFTFSHRGERNFIIRLLDSQGIYRGNIANEIGNADGEGVEGLEAGDWFLEIQADGQWLINVIEP
jgi:hypothetical protein